MKTSSIFVVAVCRNEEAYAEDFLQDLLNSCEPVQIVIVDNASNDACRTLLERYVPQITLLRQEQNLGFGIANNVGIRYALEHGAEYIFLLNVDMRVPVNAIGELLSISRKHPEFGIISPICLNFERTGLEKMFFESITDRNRFYSSEIRCLLAECIGKKKFSKELYQSSYINAAHWFMPVDVWRKTGGFNPIFYPIYGEDAEYLIRLEHTGFKIGFTPSVLVFHDTEKRPKSSIPDVHFWCVHDYVKILGSDRWRSFYFVLCRDMARLVKNILCREKERFRFSCIAICALLRHRKFLRICFRKIQRNDPLDFYTDVRPEFIPSYLKKK